RLEELPSDGPVPFDQRAELPEREPVANQVGHSGHRGRARATVDQGNLAKVVARAEGGEMDAFAGDRCFPGVDEEEGGASGSFHDDRFALLEGTYLEQAGDLLGLPSVHIGEELDALEGGHRVARGRAGRWCLAARLPGGDRAALKEVKCSILERPFDVAPRAINLLALQGEKSQGRELGVAEAELVHLGGRHLFLEGAPVRERADRNAFAPSLALQHLAGAVNAKVVWD